MLIRESKGNYNLVKSDCGKHIRVKGDDRLYSQGTEYADKPVEYEEADE